MASEIVREQAYTKGIESFLTTLKRTHNSTFHKLSPKHFQHYVDEFAGRHNIRNQNTITQKELMRYAMEVKRLTYGNLIADYRLGSGARE